MYIKKLFTCGAMLSFIFINACNDGIKEKDNAPDDKVEKLVIDYAKFGINDLTKTKSIKAILTQTWDNKEDIEDSRGQSASENIDIVSRGFSFYEDGSVIKNLRGDGRQGKWILNDTKKPFSILIKFNSGDKETYQIAKLTPFLLTLSDENGSEKKLVDYIAQGISYKNTNDDPFSISNNTWRIKPTKPESADALKNRLKSCIHFYTLFYDHNINTNAKTVNFSGLPTPFRWYAGGIFLYKEKELPVKWMACFYDNTQALKAYKIAEELLEEKYSWPKGETNWLKQNVYVLKQMEAKL